MRAGKTRVGRCAHPLQLANIEAARGYFRYPLADADGFRAMRAETIVGWRDVHYPGSLTCGERPGWEGSAIYAAAATLDPRAVGFAQQMFADRQFFQITAEQMRERSLRVTASLLGVPEQYEILRAQPPSASRLPMSPGQPDFAWADEEDGVLAVKHGDEIFYASLYWRARHAINNLARVHYLTPHFDRIAVVREMSQFEPSGLEFKRHDWINFGFANGGLRYPGNLHSAHAGENCPSRKSPPASRSSPARKTSTLGKPHFISFATAPTSSA